VADVPLPGPAVRFDYQSVDTAAGRLYIAHMNAGTLLAFDTRARRVIADLPGFPSVHGVWAVPELGKVYAAVAGGRQVAVVDAATLQVRARRGPIGYPDGIAYAPDAKRVFVSDESSAGRELVIDGPSDQVVGTIALGGEAGNTIYEPVSRCILVAVQTENQVVAIDPRSDSIVGRYSLEGARRPHGLGTDPERRLLFVANEGNATLLVVDLRSMRVISKHDVGGDPDVLAFDPGLGRLYVAAESGTVSVFREQDRDLVHEGDLQIPHAHTVAVDPATHLVYLPLERVNGRPVLRIMAP
jgi:DNA-binding beta-propeller fold protein YncE